MDHINKAACLKVMAYYLFSPYQKKALAEQSSQGFKITFNYHVTGYGPGTNCAALTDRIVRSEAVACCDMS